MTLPHWQRFMDKGTAALALILTFASTSVQAQYVPEFPFYPKTYQDVVDILNDFPSDITYVRRLQENTDNAEEPLVALVISDNPQEIEDEPVILLTGVIHGKEPMGMRAVLELADNLVSNYDSDTAIRDIVDSYQIVIVPTMNVWGYENRFRTNNDIDLLRNPLDPGVDLNRNGLFGWKRCDNADKKKRDLNKINGPDCLEAGMGTYHGPIPNSESETRTMQDVVNWLKPLFGVVFHTGTTVTPSGQVLYPYGITDHFGNDGIRHNGDEEFLKPMSEYRVSRGLAQLLREQVLESRQEGIFCANPSASPEACALPVTGSLGSAGSTSANYYALTGMLELGIETHGPSFVDANGTSHPSPWVQDYLYEEQPVIDDTNRRQLAVAREYARTYADGIQGMLDNFMCDGQSPAASFDGPGFTGRVVDEQGNPLSATIKVLELDTTLHGDYLDPSLQIPLSDEDFKYRVAQLDTGRFYRLLPLDIDLETQSQYRIEISMESKLTTIITISNPGMGSCLRDLGDIVMLSEPEPVNPDPISQICTVAPQMTGMANGSVLPESNATLEWTSNGCHYWVWAGTGPDRNEYHNESMAGATSFTLTGYPNDGSDVYLTLLYRNTNLVGAPWNRAYFSFQAPSDRLCTQAPTLTSHQNGDTLSPGSDTISWTSNGCHFWVWVGNGPDRNDYHNESMAGTTSVSLAGYPSDGSDVYLTLLYRNTNIIGAPWDRQYFAFGAPIK